MCVCARARYLIDKDVCAITHITIVFVDIGTLHDVVVTHKGRIVAWRI